MRTVQLMKKIYIFRVYHTRIIAPKKIGSHDMKQTDCQECVRAYLSIHDCLSFLHGVMIGNHRSPQQWRGR